MYDRMLDEKDKSFRELEKLAIVTASESGSAWWEMLLVGAGGVVVGAGIAVLVIYVAK